MTYFKVGQTSEVRDGEKKTFSLNNKVLLITNIQGTYYAIDNKCPHMGGSLFDGNLDSFSITCPKHGTIFDVRNGEVIKNGKIAFIKLKVKNTRPYPVKIEGDDILIGFE